MKTFLHSIAVLVVSFACSKHELHHSVCGTSATVRDFSGKSGCGFVFELADGSKLAPSTAAATHGCGSHQDVLANFSLAEGKKVKIGFELINNSADACGAKAAKITCIEIDNTPTKE